MTNPERMTLFQSALVAIHNLEKAEPGYPPFVSIHNQILYLMALVSGQSVDRKNLAKINLGYIAMREVETQNEDVANLLYRVSAEVDQIRRELQAS
jgi:hypothetical protein